MKHLLLTTITVVMLVGCGKRPSDDTVISKNSNTQTSSSYEDNNQQANLELFSAISRNNIKRAKQALARGADINSKNNNGRTPLMVAAETGNVDMAKLLAVKEAEPNSHHKGWTSLHRAAFYGNIEIVDFLIEMGLDIDVKDDRGQTPIHWPANYGRVQMVNHLLSKGADANAVAIDGVFSGQAPLDAAIKDNHSAVAALLRRHSGKTAEELKAEGK